MKKLSIIMALVLVALFAFAACGTPAASPSPSDSPSASDAPAPSVAPPAPSDAPVATPDEPAAPSDSTATGDKPLVGISVPEAPTGWVAAVQWSAESNAKALGLNYKMAVSANPNEQANQIDELISLGCKTIVLFPHNDELAVAAQKIIDAGITLINFDRTLGSTKPDHYVAGNNKNMGIAGGEYIVEKLGGKGKVVIVYTPNLGNIFEERKKGFEEVAAKNTGLEIIGTYTPENASAEAALTIMSDVLTQNPQIDAIYSTDDESSIGMLQAIKEAKRTDIKVITGGGGAQNYFKIMGDYPDIWASSQTYAPYMMKDCIEMAAGLNEGKTYPAETIIPTSCVDRTNYQEYLDKSGITSDAPY